jgi:hypothetical protein
MKLAFAITFSLGVLLASIGLLVLCFTSYDDDAHDAGTRIEAVGIVLFFASAVIGVWGSL